MNPSTRVALAAGFAVGLASGCRYFTAPRDDAPTRPDVRPWVTAAIAGGLDPSGNFILTDPPPDAGNAAVSARQVLAVARIVARDIVLSGTGSGNQRSLGVVSARSAIEDAHGAPINWDRVSVAEWPLYARTPVSSIPDSVPEYVRRALGSRTHILLYDGSSAVADIALSNSLAHVQLTNDSASFSAPPPSELSRIAGLPAAFGNALPLLPEVAVKDIATRTSARVDRPPRLLLPWDHLGPAFSRWAIHVDRDVSVVSFDTGEPIRTRDILIGAGTGVSTDSLIKWYVAASDQPSTSTWPIVGPSNQVDSISVGLAPDVPTKVIRVRRP